MCCELHEHVEILFLLSTFFEQKLKALQKEQDADVYVRITFFFFFFFFYSGTERTSSARNKNPRNKNPRRMIDSSQP